MRVNSINFARWHFSEHIPTICTKASGVCEVTLVVHSFAVVYDGLKSGWRGPIKLQGVTVIDSDVEKVVIPRQVLGR